MCVCSLLFTNPLPSRTAAAFQTKSIPVPNFCESNQGDPNRFTDVPNAKLICVVFVNDYASAKILDPDNEVLVSESPLC